MNEKLSSRFETEAEEMQSEVENTANTAQSAPNGQLISKRFAKNLSFAFSSQFLVQVLSIGIGIVIARSLTVSEYGLYNLAVAFPNLFGLLFSLALDYIIVREIVHHPNLLRQVWKAGIEIRIVSIASTIGLISLAAMILGYNPIERQFIFMYSISIAITSLGDSFRALFQALQQMQYDVISRGADKVVAAVIIVIAAFTIGLNVDLIFIALLIGPLAGLVVVYGLVRRHIPNFHTSSSYTLQERVALIKQSVPIMMSMIANNFLQQVPGVVLSRMRSHEEMGFFSVGNSLIAPFYIFSAVLSATLLPIITERHAGSPEEFRRFHNRFLLILVGVSILLTALVIIFSPLAVQIVYGSDYGAGAEAVQLYALIIPVIFVGTYLNALFIAVHSQKWLLIAMVSSLIAALVLSPLAIQIAGYRGAALISGIAPYVGNLLLIYIAYTRIIPARRQQNTQPT